MKIELTTDEVIQIFDYWFEREVGYGITRKYSVSNWQHPLISDGQDDVPDETLIVLNLEEKSPKLEVVK